MVRKKILICRKKEKTKKLFFIPQPTCKKKNENVFGKSMSEKNFCFFLLLFCSKKTFGIFGSVFFFPQVHETREAPKKNSSEKVEPKDFFSLHPPRLKKAKQWRSIQNKNVFLGKSQGLLPRPGKLFPWPYKTFENNVTVLVFVWFLHRLEKKKRFEKLEEWKKKKKVFSKVSSKRYKKKNFQDQKTSLVKQKQTKNESWTHLCARRPNVLS